MKTHFYSTFLVDHTSCAQILLFTLIVSSFWVLEKFLLQEEVPRKWQHTTVNAFLILSALPLQLLFNTLLVPLTHWEEVRGLGLIYLLPHSDNPWVKYVLMFFVLDFMDYVYHAFMHKIPYFWKFHLVHHTDTKVDVSTTLREHPGETFFRNCFLLLVVLTCGASFGVLMIRQTGQTLSNILAHTSLRLSSRAAKILGWIFITPNLHHVHHHFKQPYTDCNYGDTFSIWDRLFRTFSGMPAENVRFGLDSHADEINYGSHLVLMPFLPKEIV